MEKNSKIYIAGHRGLVGSAIVKNLEAELNFNDTKPHRTMVELTDSFKLHVELEIGIYHVYERYLKDLNV